MGGLTPTCSKVVILYSKNAFFLAIKKHVRPSEAIDATTSKMDFFA